MSNSLGASGVPHSDSTTETNQMPHRSPNWSYEETVIKIEAIISGIEMGELELAEVFDQFATAVNHLHQCEAFLLHQQQQMDLLVETLLDNPDF
jgi:exodeoxyribonuclease VII small subunit